MIWKRKITFVVGVGLGDKQSLPLKDVLLVDLDVSEVLGAALLEVLELFHQPSPRCHLRVASGKKLRLQEKRGIEDYFKIGEKLKRWQSEKSGLVDFDWLTHSVGDALKKEH